MEYTGDASILSNGTVILDFYATWCGPCKRMKPKVLEMAESMPQITFVCIDTEEWTALTERYDITALPTLIKLFNGKVIERHEGVPRDLDYWVRGLK